MLLTASLAVLIGLPIVAAQPAWSQGQPHLQVHVSHENDDHFHVGDTVTWLVQVSNAAGADTITSTIVVTGSLNPKTGMSDIHPSGYGWSFSSDQGKLVAKYANPNLKGGESLSTIKIAGKLTEDAVPHLTGTAEAKSDSDDVSASNTISVQNADCGCQKSKPQPSSHKSSNPEPDHKSSSPAPANTPKVPVSSSNAVAIANVSIASSTGPNVSGINGGSFPSGGISGDPLPPGIGSAGDPPGLPNTGNDPLS
jgi:hypothetical protein